MQIVLRHVVDGLNPQACSDAPRWRINDTGALTVESTASPEVIEGLRGMDHVTHVAARDSLDFGSAQLIVRLGTETV